MIEDILAERLEIAYEQLSAIREIHKAPVNLNIKELYELGLNKAIKLLTGANPNKGFFMDKDEVSKKLEGRRRYKKIIEDVIKKKKAFWDNRFLCIPLIAQGREVIGVIILEGFPEKPFTYDDVKILLPIISSLANVIQNMKYAQAQLKKQFGDKLGEEIYNDKSKLEPKYLEKTTVLFADIRGATKLVDCLSKEPTLFSKVMQDFYEKGREIILDHSGIVDKFLGDGLMAIFGVNDEQPYGINDENPPSKAVLSALKLEEWFDKEFFPKWKDDFIKKLHKFEDIALGIGIATEDSMVGNFGRGELINFTSLGKSPSLASRICDEAREKKKRKPKSIILIDEGTKQYLPEGFEIEHFKDISPKNMPHRYPIYRIMGV
ncbi:MAG: adenylate/guanylate cyclase domain-containing protein [bacterium]